MTARLLSAATLAVFSVGISAQLQTPQQTPTGLIVGRVVDAGNGQGIGGVLVTLTITQLPPPSGQRPAPNPPRRVMTEPGGGFVFTEVPPGRHALMATKGGYADGGYGKKRPGGDDAGIDVLEGARVGDVTLKMWKFSAVAGTVLDEAGEPVVNVTVHALEKRYEVGRLRLSRGANATTDDRGVYRIGNLLPGDYVVAVPSATTTLPGSIVDEYFRDPVGSRDLRTAIFGATALVTPPGMAESARVGDLILQGGRGAVNDGLGAAEGRAVYPTYFYPASTTSGQATIITLGSGETRGGLDVRLRPLPALRVSGILKGPDGPVALQAVRLAAQSTADDIGPDNSFDAAVAMTDRRGAFTFLGVPAGQYVLRATKSPRPAGRGTASTPPAVSSDPTLWAIEPVTVGARDVAIDVTMKLALRVSGTFVFEGSAPRPSSRPIMLTIEGAEGRGQFNSVSPPSDPNAFSASGLPGGRYLLHSVSVPAGGWIMKSATFEGRDVADTPFDLKSDMSGIVVTFTDKIARLSGTVRNAQSTAATDALVIMFPADPAGWVDVGRNPRRIRRAPVDASGRYEISPLVAGDYFVAAVLEEAVTDARSPKLFEALTRSATRIQITEGSQVTQDLRPVVVR